MTADTFKSALKLFSRLKATALTEREKRVVTNMKAAFVEFIQEKQPEMNLLKSKLQSLFVYQVSYLFLVLCQLLWEIRQRQELWVKLGKFCLNTIQVMQNDLVSIAISANKNWDQQKKRIEVRGTRVQLLISSVHLIPTWLFIRRSSLNTTK